LVLGSPGDSPTECRATNAVWISSRKPTTSRGGDAGARERFHSQGLDHGVSSLAPRAEWFVGLRHHRRGCSSSDRDTDTAPVQRRTGSRGPVRPSRPEGQPRRSGLLSWGSSIAPPPTRPSLRPLPSRPSPGLRPGTATSRARSAPAVPPGSSGFLRSRPDPKIRPFDCPRVCCTPQPAMGFTTFRIPCAASRPRLDPKVVDLAVHPGIVPCGEDPTKPSPPR
jgi:hypothetical protein